MAADLEAALSASPRSPRAELVAVDLDLPRASEAGRLALTYYRDLPGKVDAAIVSASTAVHAEIGARSIRPPWLP